MTLRLKGRPAIVALMLTVGAHAGLAKAGKNPLAELNIRELTARVSQSVVEVSVHGYAASDDNTARVSDRISSERSIGSGEIVDAHGSIMTNAHGVDGATTVKVTVEQDGSAKTYDAHVVGSDNATDLALLKIDATNRHRQPHGFAQFSFYGSRQWNPPGGERR